MSDLSVAAAADARESLIERGFCVFPNVLTEPLLGEIRRVTDALCDEVPEDLARKR